MRLITSGLRLEVANSFSDAPLQDEWDDLLRGAASNVVFLTRQWQEIWWSNFSARALCSLCMLTIYDKDRDSGGALIAIAPLFIETAALPPIQEYSRGVLRPEGAGKPQRIVRFVGGIDVADYLDIIAAPDRMREAWSSVLDYLLEISSQWDVIDFHSLPDFSPSRELLAELALERGLHAQIFPEDVCPVVPLPGDWETYLMSLRKKDRHELRRKVRKLEGRDDARWYLVNPRDDEALQQGMQSFIALHRLSGTDKAAFMDEAMAASFLDMAHRLAHTGWLDLAVLEVNKEPAAAYLSFNYNGRLYLYNSGYDPQFGSYSAGVALLAYRIHKAILQGVKVFDFLRGDEDYKYDFGARDTYVYRAVLRPVEETWKRET